MSARKLDANAIDDVPESPADADANLIGFAARDLARRQREFGCRGVDRSGFLEQPPSGLGEVHAVAMAYEQRDAQLFLELVNMAAEGWLRDMQTLGRFGHTERLGYGDEGLHSPQIHAAQMLYQIGMPEQRKMYWTA